MANQGRPGAVMASVGAAEEGGQLALPGRGMQIAAKNGENRENHAKIEGWEIFPKLAVEKFFF